MKLGVLTFHCAHNYGAVIQCYALQKYLESLGHDVYVVDYRPSYILNFYAYMGKQYWKGNTIFKILLNLLLEMIRVPLRIRRRNAFERFISRHLRLYPYLSNDDLSIFDYVIVGSDQVWNANISGGYFDPLFFGKGLGCKTIAYAASNRSYNLSDEEKQFYRQNLSNFHSISVRESSLQALLQPLTNKSIVQVLDPTLLAGDVFLNSLHLEKKVNFNYILIYEINPHDNLYNLAKSCAAKYSYRLLEIYSRVYAGHLKERVQTASPEDWVSYIRYAETVFTTSFHGICLSILLKKDFYYIKQNTDADGRILSLLSLLKLDSRIVENNVLNDSPIEYESVFKLLNQKRIESGNFIQSALLS